MMEQHHTSAASTSGRQERELDLDTVTRCKFATHHTKYTSNSLILYALGLGCTLEKDFRFLYEQHPKFAALATFSVVAAHPVTDNITPALQSWIPGYSKANQLHGEQYLELHSPLPTSGALATTAQVVSLERKGRGATAVLRTTTVDALTGHVIATNEFTSFVLNTGPFRTVGTKPERPPAATARNAPPTSRPDAVVLERIDADRAALYRLNGDLNPLHVDPARARAVGFDRPILHGLCTMGVSVKHVMQKYSRDDPATIKTVKVRFSSHVFPGETLRTEMWRDGPDRVIFQTCVVERDVVVISNAAVGFVSHLLQGQQPVRSSL